MLGKVRFDLVKVLEESDVRFGGDFYNYLLLNLMKFHGKQMEFGRI